MSKYFITWHQICFQCKLKSVSNIPKHSQNCIWVIWEEKTQISVIKSSRKQPKQCFQNFKQSNLTTNKSMIYDKNPHQRKDLACKYVFKCGVHGTSCQESHISQRKVWNSKATAWDVETKANSVQKHTHRQD